ncbi:hypothetical protein HRR77_009519 [Exophiala dermatitidis]|nr:hypothetical protein HRR77_009519 [Exophiala dermatitidis]
MQHSSLKEQKQYLCKGETHLAARGDNRGSGRGERVVEKLAKEKAQTQAVHCKYLTVLLLINCLDLSLSKRFEGLARLNSSWPMAGHSIPRRSLIVQRAK